MDRAWYLEGGRCYSCCKTCPFFLSKMVRGGMNRNLPRPVCACTNPWRAGGPLARSPSRRALARDFAWQHPTAASNSCGLPGSLLVRKVKQRELKIRLYQDLDMIWCSNLFVLYQSLWEMSPGTAEWGRQKLEPGTAPTCVCFH